MLTGETSVLEEPNNKKEICTMFVTIVKRGHAHIIAHRITRNVCVGIIPLRLAIVCE